MSGLKLDRLWFHGVQNIKKLLYLDKLNETATRSVREDRKLSVVGGRWRLVCALDDCVEAPNVIGGVGHGADCAIRLGQAVTSRDDAVFEAFLDILNIASLEKMRKWNA